jgi:hypothetical protein
MCRFRRVLMLSKRVLAEDNGQTLAVILLEVAQGRPQQKARHALEISEFFQDHRSGGHPANVRRLGARSSTSGRLSRYGRLNLMLTIETNAHEKGCRENGADEEIRYVTSHTIVADKGESAPVVTAIFSGLAAIAMIFPSAVSPLAKSDSFGRRSFLPLRRLHLRQVRAGFPSCVTLLVALETASLRRPDIHLLS